MIQNKYKLKKKKLIKAKLNISSYKADLRDTNLEDVVLDQLFTQHDDAELNAKLNEAASWRTLGETHTSVSQQQQMLHLITQERRSADPQASNTPLPSGNHWRHTCNSQVDQQTCKEEKKKKIHSLCWFFYPLTDQDDAQVLPSLEERHVKNGRIGVYELQQEGFQDEALLKVGFSFGNLYKNNREGMKMQNIEKVEFRWEFNLQEQREDHLKCFLCLFSDR